MIVLLDNYDSFVHNLARYFRRLGRETTVVRNDETSPHELQQLRPAAIVISPGPCTPHEAGVSLEVVRQCSGDIPILGVCLGHQTIVAAFGGEIVRATVPMHGRVSEIRHHGNGVFQEIPSPFTVCRYHSLIAQRDTLPACLTVTAETSDGVIMAVQHNTHPTVGVQFHPEAILTEHGDIVLKNFLKQISTTKGEREA